MLNVPELEQRWKKYRRTRQVPYLIGSGAVVLTIVIAAFVVMTPDTQVPTEVKIAGIIKPSPVQETAAVSSTQQVVAPSQVLTAEVEETPYSPGEERAAIPTMKLTPSMEFMEEMESDVMDYYAHVNTQPAPVIRNDPPAVQPKSVKQAPTPAPVISAPPEEEIQNIEAPSPQAESLPSIQPQKSVKSMQSSNEKPQEKVDDTEDSGRMTILRDDDMKDIQDVIARFKKSKNPVLSLFVAKRYYNIGNYQQAYNYALITNELDSTIEDSWLIFAKSLYKMDQKEMAIKTLKSYIQESSSVKAKLTLDQMEKGSLE
ncbi:hypothetical protein WCX18_03345 [Sulfurimonas sp. HSL1-2]|uniref:tetratricopeptide repeat protein n=1 Tax=Thiomicrolovo zhangzhouensis TaxID=3131933 RepID=UPI0031F77500